jgi:hypothetical protein
VRDDLPTGTVTFLFTDVADSTKLLHSLGADARRGAGRAPSRHQRGMRGPRRVEVDTQGDAFFFAFPTAPGALAAAGALTEAFGLRSDPDTRRPAYGDAAFTRAWDVGTRMTLDEAIALALGEPDARAPSVSSDSNRRPLSALTGLPP